MSFEVIFLTTYVNSDTYALSRYLILKESILYDVDVFTSGITSYMNLKENNEKLAQYNVRLLEEITQLKETLNEYVKDSISQTRKIDQPYVTFAKVISNSIVANNNFIVLDCGSKNGVAPGMAIVNGDGIVGYVKNVSRHYAVGISVLSTENFTSSAKIKGTSYTGSLIWDGKDYRKLQMVQVTKYAPLNIGDTITTTAYSSFFPENVPIGTIENFESSSGLFYSINVKLFADMSSLDYVFVLQSTDKLERDALENEVGVNK